MPKKYDKEYLITKLVMMRVKGKSTHTILEFLQEKVGMCRATSYEYLKEAQLQLLEQQSDNLDVAYGEAIAQLEELYEATNDKRVKLSIRAELSKLQGLHKPSRVDLTTNGKDLTITDITIEIVNKKEDLEDE